ncbi:MAG TPA: NADH-ubiquinone oxidoreductase-F iron-sulfur binding region domain-containing protein [Thermomicrobiales bacterium]|nr:NADH-ubiquinone oxidoreductase-F iron-sulfur binding region domain-containing protein [Thermomicrobiales bacterium]
MADRSRFDALKADCTKEWEALRASDKTVVTVNIHGGSIPVGAEDVYQGLRYETETHGHEIVLRHTGSLGFEFAEPIVQVRHPGAPTVVYGHVAPDDVPELVAKTIATPGVWPEKALGYIGDEGLTADLPCTSAPVDTSGMPDYQGIRPLKEHPFMRRQSRWLMRRWGAIDPDNIHQYIATGGYEGYVKALTEMTPQDVLDEVKKANVKGRGGAGFPMGIKWESGRKSRGDTKYVICNGHEGEPNVFKDRRTFESDPHSVLEGIIIGCYAVGASIGYCFIGGEYPLGIKRFKQAVKDAEAAGLLGKDILGTGFNCEVRVRIGGGAYISGEASALIYSVQGDRAQPRTKPPRSVEYGLWGKPTVVNNVETLANAPDIVIKGGDWFHSIGPDHSTGTKLITISGPIKYTGVAEIVMDMSARDLIEEVYGGMREGSTLKGFQTGGVSGACMLPEQLHLNVDFQSLDEVGGMLGSAGFIVLDQRTCAVDWARWLMNFNAEESCGKCTPCRLGCPAMTEVLDRIRFGSGVESDLDLINYAGKQIIDISLCGLGQAAPAPILSLVENYRDEFLAHIRDHVCPAGQCPIDAAVAANWLVPGTGQTVDDPIRLGQPRPLPAKLPAD